MSTRNSGVLADFVAYCQAHPTERFWQALRNWSDSDFLLASNDYDPFAHTIGDMTHDTFYWEGRNQ